MQGSAPNSDVSNPSPVATSARWVTEIHGESCITASSQATQAGAMYSHETGGPQEAIC